MIKHPLFTRSIHIISTSLLLAGISLPQLAYANAQVPPPPSLAVKAYLVTDFNSGHVIATQNAKMRVEPASLTKIMTAYLSLKALKNGHLQLSQTLPVSEKAWKVEGSKMFIEPNKPVTVDELLHGMITVSGNDASITLAEGIASSEELFAGMMNKEAQRLGMKNTHYMNATGLPDPQHYTTAEDLSKLATALINDFPEEYKRLYSIKEYEYNNIKQPNR
ncbi:MAG: peptidase, partial [Mehylophilales bacterium 35-46-6]